MTAAALTLAFVAATFLFLAGADPSGWLWRAAGVALAAGAFVLALASL